MAEQPDVAVVRQWWETCMKDLDAAAGMMTGDVVHHVPGKNPMAGAYKGRDNVMQMYRRYGEMMESAEMNPVAMMADGHGHVVSVMRNRYQRDGRTLELHEAMLFTVTGGKISGIEEFSEDLDASDDFWK
jgi:uncharacterized protein